MSGVNKDSFLGGSDLKYARGVSARPARDKRPLSVLEWVVLAHASILLLWTTWGFGGAAEWMHPYLTWWGVLGGLITLTALQHRESWRSGEMRVLWWLAPLAAFNGLVGLASLNPSLREINVTGEIALANTGGYRWLPSSARPQLAIPALLLFDALWITCFNIALIVRQRRALRGLLLLVAANALALSVFGTAQKLAHASGIYFGAVKTKQPYFFASFVYHNHWGAFMLLMLAAVIGLVWHYARSHVARNFFHSPAFGGLVVAFLLAATVPLSGSRSCTLALLLLGGGAFLHWILVLLRRRRQMNESAAPPLVGAAAALVLGTAGIWFVARESITVRAALTRQQVETMVEHGSIGARSVLYRDTWKMARDKLWFGWGMESYPHVFSRFYNSQSSPVDRLPVFYRDAHSDWLQAFAEHGLVGTALIALSALVPLWEVRSRRLTNPLAQYLLAGCALVLLYAWVEFPFGNVSVVFSWWLCFFCAVQYTRLQSRGGSAPPVSVPR
jgi:O-antigen ligase